jgi:plasmid stabilization system protein ParE
MYHARIAQDKPDAADKWAMAVRSRMLSLRQFPFRCEIIPEAEHWGLDYRHLIFGNHRIIFRVTENRVIVVRVVHGFQILRRRMLPEA